MNGETLYNLGIIEVKQWLRKNPSPNSFREKIVKAGVGLAVLGMRRQRQATKSVEEEAMREELDMPSEIMYRSVSPPWHGDDGPWKGCRKGKGGRGVLRCRKGNERDDNMVCAN